MGVLKKFLSSRQYKIFEAKTIWNLQVILEKPQQSSALQKNTSLDLTDSYLA